MNIFVGNLEYHVSEEELKKAFSSYGNVESVRIVFNRHTGRSKGFGFVVMPNDPEAQSAIEAMNGREINGRAVIVNESRRPDEQSEGLENNEGTNGRSELIRERERGRKDRY